MSSVYEKYKKLKDRLDAGVESGDISQESARHALQRFYAGEGITSQLSAKRKEKEMKANSKQSEIKEIRFTPSTDDHDFDFKAKHAEKFLKDGNKVKAYVQFKGRAIMFQDRGQLLLLKFAERLAEAGTLESMPKLEGKRMFAIFTPKTGKKK
jgi:hypothetical protein